MVHPSYAPRLVVLSNSTSPIDALDAPLSFNTRFAAAVSLTRGESRGGPVWSSEVIRNAPGFCCADPSIASGVFKQLVCEEDDFRSMTCNCAAGTSCDKRHVVREDEGGERRSLR